MIKFLLEASLLIGNALILSANELDKVEYFLNNNYYLYYLVPIIVVVYYVIVKVKQYNQKRSIMKLGMELIRIMTDRQNRTRVSFFEPYLFGFIKIGILHNFALKIGLPVKLKNTLRVPNNLPKTKVYFLRNQGGIGLLWAMYNRNKKRVFDIYNSPEDENEYNNLLSRFAKKEHLVYKPCEEHKPYLKSYFHCVMHTLHTKRLLGIFSIDSNDPEAFSKLDNTVLARIPLLIDELAGTLKFFGRD